MQSFGEEAGIFTWPYGLRIIFQGCRHRSPYISIWNGGSPRFKALHINDYKVLYFTVGAELWHLGISARRSALNIMLLSSYFQIVTARTLKYRTSWPFLSSSKAYTLIFLCGKPSHAVFHGTLRIRNKNQTNDGQTEFFSNKTVYFSYQRIQVLSNVHVSLLESASRKRKRWIHPVLEYGVVRVATKRMKMLCLFTIWRLISLCEYWPGHCKVPTT
jgi:hypothetical protein